MISFETYWVGEYSRPPATDAERGAFRIAHDAWRNALARGQLTQPANIEGVLERVASGMSTAGDALVIREYLTTQVFSIENLDAQLVAIEQQAEAHAIASQQADASRKAAGIPAGAHPMGGTRWRCPRCSFVAGNVRHEPACRACSFPGEDTRDWYNEDGTEKDVVPNEGSTSG